MRGLPSALAVVVLAGGSTGCDLHQFGDAAPPSLTGLSPAATRAGNNVTVLGDNLDLTPWALGDGPPRSDDPDPVSPLPYELTASIGGLEAEVRSVSSGGVVLRVPEELAPGRYGVFVTVQDEPSNTLALDVIDEPDLHIAIVPDPLLLEAGSSRAVRVFALDAAGAVRDVTADAVLELRLSDESSRFDLFLDDAGAVVGLEPARGTLRATLGFLFDDAAVQVVYSREGP